MSNILTPPPASTKPTTTNNTMEIGSEHALQDGSKKRKFQSNGPAVVKKARTTSKKARIPVSDLADSVSLPTNVSALCSAANTPSQSDDEMNSVEDLEKLEYIGDSDMSDDDTTLALKKETKGKGHIFTLSDHVRAELHGLFTKHGQNAETAEAMLYSLSNIIEFWGRAAAKKPLKALVDEIEYAVCKTGDQFDPKSKKPHNQDQTVRYEVGSVVAKVLSEQQWREKIMPKSGMKEDFAVTEEQIESLESIQAGMISMETELLKFVAEATERETTSSEHTDRTISFTPINGRPKPQTNGKKNVAASEPPKGGSVIDFAAFPVTASDTASSSKATPKSKVKKEPNPKTEPKSKAAGADGRKKACGIKWTPQEEAFLISKWCKNDLRLDMGKMTGVFKNCPPRAGFHTDWLVAQGFNPRFYWRTWDAME